MRLILTGDVARPGQQRNIAWLARTLCPLLAGLGHDVDVHLGEALEFDEWVAGFFERPAGFAGEHSADTIFIGFELPPGFRATLPRWIDLRVHPLRFLVQRYFSAESSPGLPVDRAASELCPWLKRPEVQPVDLPGAACMTLQVQHDASLITPAGLLTPDEVMPELRAFAERFERLIVVPHPEQPHNDWREGVLAEVPNAEVTLLPAYTVMASVPEMITVNSSTAWEAPWMGPRPGCRPTMLREPWWSVSPPVDITSRAFWAAALKEEHCP